MGTPGCNLISSVPFLLAITAALFVGTPVAAAAEQRFPTRAIEIIVAYPPGGVADTSVRVIEPYLSKVLGVPIALVTKAGAGGTIATEYVKRASPDGYTLLAPTSTPLTTAPITTPNVSYSLSDFVAIGNIVTDPTVIVSKPTDRWKTLDEFVGRVKSKPGTFNSGDGGSGGTGFFAMELIKAAYGLDIVAVHFKGSGPLKNAVLGNHVDVASGNFSSFAPVIKSGDVSALVLLASKRHKELPNVPTIKEKGFPTAALVVSSGLFAPAGTPPQVIETLARALATVMRDPEVVNKLERAWLVADYQNGAEYTRFLGSEHEQMKALAKQLGLSQ